MATSAKARPLFDLPILGQAAIDSFKKLTPQRQVRNPVMFVVYVGSILTTLLWCQTVLAGAARPSGQATVPSGADRPVRDRLRVHAQEGRQRARRGRRLHPGRWRGDRG